ncbi:MAG: type III-A CRISPR-associated protein Csm2 [Ruminococcus sp.]|nr:type III-A CRISPR-associated protein Csm2 [Ruminococcus sp.]
MKINKLNYVKQAETVMGCLFNENNGKYVITSSQMRNIHSLIMGLYDSVRLNPEEQLDEETKSQIQYVKMRIVYIAGRDKANNKNSVIEKFLNRSELLNYIDSIGSSRDDLILVCRYMEALVAYHKFDGGR